MEKEFRKELREKYNLSMEEFYNVWEKVVFSEYVMNAMKYEFERVMES